MEAIDCSGSSDGGWSYGSDGNRRDKAFARGVEAANVESDSSCQKKALQDCQRELEQWRLWGAQQQQQERATFDNQHLPSSQMNNQQAPAAHQNSYESNR